jgi:hypothetical protein
MPTLHPDLRGTLEKTVCDARDIAEQGARAALEALAVGEAEPYKHLTPDQRDFRNRLRARGRQLGDRRDERKGTQEITRLVRQCAYEYWHRMLFARFLAENNLLMHPEGVAVSLEECEELAAEEGIDAWTLASRYAARMLPQIFRPDDVLLQIAFALEHKQALEQLLAALPSAVFTASDSLGWVYQFWQAKRKKEVNDSGNKIGADELPAVTQLFTEDYMVDFLLQNTLGAWWVGHHPTDPLPVEMPYLRFVENPHPPTPASHVLCPSDSKQRPTPKTGEGELETPPTLPISPTLPLSPSPHLPPSSTPAAGTFPGWPTTAKELRILDPCCGSGHFLVAEFNLLVPMRMREEGLSAQAACDAVLQDNILGLEIDERCTQIAAFALAMAAWTYPGAGGYRQLPKLNIACSGIAISAKREDWLALAGDDMRLQLGMARLYTLFQDAAKLGSLIKPSGDKLALEADFEETLPLLFQALKHENKKKVDRDFELGVVAQGIAEAARLLSLKYHLVATNVPYLFKGKQSDFLVNYTETHYPISNTDIATVFVERCFSFLNQKGTAALVTTQNWLFLKSYKKLREFLMKNCQWSCSARLGEKAFRSPQAAGAFAALVIYSKDRSSGILDNELFGIDVSSLKTTDRKSISLREGEVQCISQRDILNRPDSIIATEKTKKQNLLSKYATCYQGTSTGDNPRFVRYFWEMPYLSSGWEKFQAAPQVTTTCAGREHIVDWEEVKKFENAAVRGEMAWKRDGVAIGQMRKLPATLYSGNLFSNTTPVIIPNDSSDLAALWLYCQSEDFCADLRTINPKLSVDNGYVGKIEWDASYWRSLAEEVNPQLIIKSSEPSQWTFDGKIENSHNQLQVAVAHLLGYRWSDCTDYAFEGLIDDDGIVCVPSIRSEQPASERLRNLLVKAYGKDWTSTKLRELLEPDGYGDRDLDDWLRNCFFDKHCEVFQSRPFIWHIWDGLKDGFAALVNYHKLDYKGLETLAYTYLGDWIRDQQAAVKAGISGADNKLLKAQQLQKKLALILQGEAPYDIFIRWKPLDQQPIGWHPDFNDGVRLNIRPFVQAGVLRKTPNIKWNKDRGKNPPDSPWGEDRNNDIHLTLEQKRPAQEAPQP